MHTLRLRARLFVSTLLVLLLLAGNRLAVAIARLLPPDGYRAMTVVALTTLLFPLGAMASYRVLVRLFPLPVGNVGGSPRAVFAHEVHLLFNILVFVPMARCGLLTPLMRLFYLGLGARMGRNSYCAGVIYEPSLVEMGDDCLLGSCCQVVSHVLNGQRRAYFPIRLGNNVTVGPNTVVMGGVTIGDGAIIEANAFVPSGSRVGAGEVWTGVPARPLTLADLMRRRVPKEVPPGAPLAGERAA